MSNYKIYHNPRCSKSRQTLKLLQDSGVDYEIIEYLKSPPSCTELSSIVKKLGLTVDQLLRKKEPEFQTLQLADKSEKDLLQAMSDCPKLIERPIVVYGNKAVIGRPPENVLPLIS
jgi:arsenate reductase